MSADKHTPGPWRASLDPTAQGAPLVIYPPGSNVRIAKVCRGPHRFDYKANARLMAAAPDLLAVVRMCVERDPAWGIVRHNAFEALDKATGGAE